MTELYPLLTVENINYWYWGVKPHWSTVDIAKSVGCGDGTVYNFMKSNNIPTRSRSEANVNRFNCPHKLKAFLKQVQSEENRTHLSLVTQENMKKPEVYKKYLEAYRKSRDKVISKFQKVLLYLLTTHKALFVTDFLRIVNGDLKSVDSTLRALYKRQLISRVKAVNSDCFNNFKLHYKYSITEKGKSLIAEKLKDKNCEFRNLLKDKIPEEKDKLMLQKEFLRRENIGKHQFVILKTIQQEGSQFLLDLVISSGLPKMTIDSSLRCLSSRGFLDKEKKENLSYQGCKTHRKQYYYSITDKCPTLIY